MKKTIFLFFFLILTHKLFAEVYRDSGPYGSLGYAYLSNEYDGTKGTSFQQDFIQEYKLGYKGIVYSPKLLDYSLEGTLRYEDIKSEFDGVKSDTRSEGQNYNLDFNFFKMSKAPFRIYAQKTDRPTSIVYADTINRSLQDSQSTGITGRVDLDMFDITYTASNFNGTYESLISNEERDIQTYKVSLRKQEKNYNLQLSYSDVTQILEKEYYGREKTVTNDSEENVELKHVWNISDALTLNTDSYHKDNKNLAITTYANVGLIWTPKSKHYGSINIQGFNIEDDYDGTKSISLSQNYGYRMTENLNLSQQAGYNLVQSGFSTSESMNIGAGASYSKAITNDTRMNISLNGTARTNSTDNNVSANNNTYTYNAQAGVNQKLNFMNSNLSVNVGHFESMNTIDETVKRENASIYLTTILFSIVRNNLSTTYYKEESELRYLDELIYRNITRMEVEDTISYASRVGIKGNIRTEVGVRYSNIDTDGKIIDRIIPKADINFKYRLGPKLMFNSDFHIDKDLTYNIMNYTFGSGLNFNSGVTTVSLGYNYNKVVSGESDVYNQYDEEGGLFTRENHSIQARIERKF